MIDAERLEYNLTRACRFDSILTEEGKRDRSVYLTPDTERLISNYALAFAQLARVQHRDGRFADAAVSMSVAHEIAPNADVTRSLLGVYYFDAGETSKAVAHYRRVLEENPSDIQSVFNLARVYDRLGRAEPALDLLERVMAAVPDDRDLVLFTVDTARRAGLVTHARAYAEQWLRRHPDDAGMREVLSSLDDAGRAGGGRD
jgi:tetratricopeptide (TPR) repeat protein